MNQERCVRIIRTETSDHGTLGRLVAEDGWQCVTLELPWRDNRPNISCIPPGKYPVLWGISPRFKRYYYRLQQVPERSGVMIHAGNLAGDASLGLRTHVQGCILLGKYFGEIKGQRAILVSQAMVREFAERMASAPFTLVITEG